jgi:hypothetical protein
MSIQTLSSNLITLRKQESINAQSLRRTLPFRDINMIDEKTIEYKGTRIEITKQAFKSLLSLVGMSQSFADKFTKLFNPDTKAQFINTMKNAMASNSGRLSNVTLVLNPTTKAVILFGKEDKLQISNEQMINVAENMIGDSSMGVSRWATDPATGIITIDAHNPNAEFKILGLNEEVFTGGVTFKNSPMKGFEVMPYVNRQWCTNGLTASIASESYQLHSLDNKNMEGFFESMQDLRRNNYAPEGFADRVRQANATPASMQEMRFAHNLIEKHAGERAEQWIPLQENMNQYNKAGFEMMSNDQMKMAKSNQSVWSVINGVTHFSTHGASIIDTNMQHHNEAEIQARIGNLLGKKSFDHENTMPNPFSSNELLQSGAMMN